MHDCILGPSGNDAIRLVRNGYTSPDYTSGVVQVWWNGQWGNICVDYSFGPNEANVICHQLGWRGAIYYTTSQHDRYIIHVQSTSLNPFTDSNRYICWA